MKNPNPEPLVPPTLTRTVASVLLVIGIFLIYIAVTNHEALGMGFALLVGLGGITTSSFALMAIITADPSWILLDLILPN